MTPELEDAETASPADVPSDCERTLALLRQQGADRLNPVDFHYMETLARRMRNQPPKVRRILEAKLALFITAYEAKHEPIRSAANNFEHQAAPVLAEGPTPLSQLLRAMAPLGQELKSVRNFRNTWSKLSAQKQVCQALGQAPKNAGPINSHMLVLRSLELMRDISPDYLSRFMSYADTLLCLDQSDLGTKARPAKPLASVKPRARTPAGS